MRLFAPSLAFVDLETTGTAATHDRITEVGIVRVDDDAGSDEPRVSQWSTLVNPGITIPAGVQALTGITNAMVRDAPSFERIADEIATRTAGALFVAHNARFDYGFLKHAFARIERTFTAKVLCTVRLSRRLFPESDEHNLDSVIARHGLCISERHRALPDAQALWSFVQSLYREVPFDAIEQAVKRVLKTPSLPPHLSPDVLDSIPECPGVYLFYGLNPLPLYIGKSRNLRERVASHFAADYRSPTDARLSTEIRRIEWEETAGEIGALLREASLVKSLMPAHNHVLRRKAQSCVLELADDGGPPRFVPMAAIEPAHLGGRYGPFSSRRSAREHLRNIAALHRLCLTTLRLERRRGPCFARQVARCAGACIGEETPAMHDARLRAALQSCSIPRWPFKGIAAIREPAPFSPRVDVHLVKDWCWLGTARDEGDLGGLMEAPPRPVFDPDIARLLMRVVARRKHEVIALPVPARSTCDYDYDGM